MQREKLSSGRAALIFLVSVTSACGGTTVSNDGGAGRGGSSAGNGGSSAGSDGGGGGVSGSSGGAAGSSGGAAGSGGSTGGAAAGSGGGTAGASAGTGGSAGGAAGGRGGSAGGAAGAAGGAAGAAGGAGGGASGRGGSAGGAAGAAGGAAGAAGTAGGAGGAAGATAAHAFQRGLSVSSRGSGTLDVFGLGADGVVYQRSYGAGGWATWGAIAGGAGTIVSDIDAASWDGARIDVFGLGINSEVYQSAYIATWTGWGSLSAGTAFSMGTATSAPATGRLWLFAAGADIALWGRYWNGAAWSAWVSAGGGLTSSPDSTSRPNRTWVVVKGGNDQMFINRNEGNDPVGGWAGYTQLPALAGGAGFTSGPCITSWSDTRIDVFARGGTAGSLWHNYSLDAGVSWGIANWEDWGGGGTITTDPPDCVAWANNRIDIVARGTNGHVWHQWWGGALGTWEDLGVY